MNESSQPIEAVSYPLLENLQALRRHHSALLQRQEGKDRGLRPSPPEILGFLQTARKLGRILSDFEQRETAQGIMDYWTSKLLSQAPRAAVRAETFYLEDFDPSTAGHTPTDVEGIARQATEDAAKANELFQKAQPGDRDILKALLLHLFKLKENSVDVYAVPLLDTDAILKQKPEARRLLNELISAGLVRRLEVPGEPPKYELTNPRLLVAWDALKELTVQRRGFRELSRGWDNGGRQSAALLDGGPALRNAEKYCDLDEIEAAFITSSRRQSDVKWRTVAAVAGIIVLAIITLEFRKEAEITKKNRELEDEKKELVQANKDLDENRKQLVQANEGLKMEKDKAERAVKEVQATLRDVQTALTNADLALNTANELLRYAQSTTNDTKRIEGINKANASLEKVRSNLNQQIGPKYNKKF